VDKWDYRFLDLARFISSWSKDDSTKVGAVITNGKRIISMGFNGLPSGINDSWQDREEKYKKVIHAEENAILFSSVNLTGSTIYTYPLCPCSRCTARIIQSGIKRVVSLVDVPLETETRWKYDIELSTEMLKETGTDFQIIRF
jgi:dCMP deaminase